MTSAELTNAIFEIIQKEMEPMGFIPRQGAKRNVPTLIRNTPEALLLIWLFRDSRTRQNKLVVQPQIGVFSKILGADDNPKIVKTPLNCQWYNCHWVGYPTFNFGYPNKDYILTSESEVAETAFTFLDSVRRFGLPRLTKLSTASGFLNYFQSEKRTSINAFKQQKQMNILEGYLMLKSLNLQ
jgi:hypothetical protein